MTEHAIIAAFATLEAAGYTRPPSWKTAADIATSAKVYRAALAHKTVEELQEVIALWVRKGTPWWPTSGQLVDAIPKREPDYLPKRAFELVDGETDTHAARRRGRLRRSPSYALETKD